METTEKSYLEQNFPFTDRNAIEENGRLLAKVGFRLAFVPYINLVVAVLMVVVSRHWAVILVAAAFAAIGILSIIKIKDFPTMDIYDDAVIIYDDMDQTKAVRIPNEEITEWSVESKEGGVSAIKFRFVFYPEIMINTFQLDKAARALSVKMHEKETRIINQKKAMKEKLEFKNPFDRFKKGK